MSYQSEVLSDSPVLYLRLNETSGTTVNDSSGNGLNMQRTYPGDSSLFALVKRRGSIYKCRTPPSIRYLSIWENPHGRFQ